jgi:hypothetical protein
MPVADDVAELACTYAALLLHDDGAKVTVKLFSLQKYLLNLG